MGVATAFGIGLTLAQMEKTMLDTAVELAAGNLSRAAAMLGISRGQLRYRQMRRASADTGQAAVRCRASSS